MYKFTTPILVASAAILSFSAESWGTEKQEIGVTKIKKNVAAQHYIKKHQENKNPEFVNKSSSLNEVTQKTKLTKTPDSPIDFNKVRKNHGLNEVQTKTKEFEDSDAVTKKILQEHMNGFRLGDEKLNEEIDKKRLQNLEKEEQNRLEIENVELQSGKITDAFTDAEEGFYVLYAELSEFLEEDAEKKSASLTSSELEERVGEIKARRGELENLNKLLNDIKKNEIYTKGGRFSINIEGMDDVLTEISNNSFWK